MRTDVKVGVLFAFVVILVGGVYYFSNGKSQEPIELASASPTAGKVTPGESSRKPTAQSPAREPTTKRSASTRPRGTRPGARDGAARSATRKPQTAANRGSGKTTTPAPVPSKAKPTGSRNQRHAASKPAPTAKTDGKLKGKAAPKDSGPRKKAAVPSGPRDRPRPAGSPPKTAEVVNDRHRVQTGDTFASLAMVYYGSERYTDLLVKANPHIKDPGRLSVGQVVEIPPAPARTARSGTASPKERTAKARRTYLVKPGDTFYGIAQAHLGSGPRWREIFELNKSVVRDDPKGLRPGQTLIMPEKRESDG